MQKPLNHWGEPSGGWSMAGGGWGFSMGWGRLILWGSLLLVVGTQLPIFLQMTLTPDAVLYDLQARCLLEGGILYRDVVEPNLPGIVWVHAIVRSLAGSSTMALRGFDLAVVASIGLLLTRFVSAPLMEKRSRQFAGELFLAGFLLFYFNTSEWCHCQRDTWMLLPSLLAVMVRWHVMTNRRSIIVWGLVEGVLWALGFWLKPFVAIPAVVVMLGAWIHSCTNKGQKRFERNGAATDAAKTPSSGLTATFSPCEGEKGRSGAVERIPIPSAQWGIGVIQTGTVIAGGVIVGAFGVVWMIGSGCWPHFVRMLTEWNGDYFVSGRNGWTLQRFHDHAARFWPWILLHGPALLITLSPLWRRRRGEEKRPVERDSIPVILLRSLYLGWISQAFALQQMFDYIHVPGLILAMAVCGQAMCEQAMCVQMRDLPMRNAESAKNQSENFALSWQSLAVPMAAAFVAWCVVTSPAYRSERQQNWLACVRACLGTQLEPRIRDELALVPFPRWTELQPLLDTIRQMKMPDGLLMAYNGNLIHLYPELSVHPPTRFVYVDALARCFPYRRSEVALALEDSGVRYVVSDLIEDGWEGDLSGDSVLPDALRDKATLNFFPYNQAPILRLGRYVLFEISGPIGELMSERCPLSRGWEHGGGATPQRVSSRIAYD